MFSERGTRGHGSFQNISSNSQVQTQKRALEINIIPVKVMAQMKSFFFFLVEMKSNPAEV